MSYTAMTPPTALFSGGKASADSLSANKEVSSASRRACVCSEHRDRVFGFAVRVGGFSFALEREVKPMGLERLVEFGTGL